MASDQFILEMHKKLHPDSDIHDTEDLTGHELSVIAGIVDDKHSIVLNSHWVPDKVRVDTGTLRNVLTSASLHCHNSLTKLNAQVVSDMTDGDGHIDPDAVTEWEDDIAYWQAQIDAITAIEHQLLEPLRLETNKEGFYMRGVVI